MIIKKNKNLDFFLNKNIDLILSLFFFIITFLFFLKSFNYSFFWYEAFKAALVGEADPIFWDFEVYKCAADLFINNQNPYNLLTGCMPSEKPFTFNYPIITAFFYIPFTLINFFSSKIIWGLILLFSFAIYIIYQKKLFKSNINFFFYFIIILFCLDKTMIYSFFTGNMSFISQILISISFYFLLERNKNIFFAIICIVSFFKFYFLIFLFCPILVYKFKYLKNIIAQFQNVFVAGVRIQAGDYAEVFPGPPAKIRGGGEGDFAAAEQVAGGFEFPAWYCFSDFLFLKQKTLKTLSF